MKLRFKFLLLLLPFLLLPSFVKAEEKTLTGEWKKIEAGTSIINSEKKNEFIEQLEAKIKALTDTSTEDGTVYDYAYRIVREYQEESKTYNTIEVSKLFTTKAEAEEYYKASEVSGKMNPKYRELFSDEFEVVCEENCEKEIQKDYVCKINPTEYNKVEKTFNSREEMIQYQPEVIEGFKYVGMVDNSGKSCAPVYLKDVYKTIYDNKQAAEDALNEFISIYGGEYVEPKQIENAPVYYDSRLYKIEKNIDKAIELVQVDLDNHIYNGNSFNGYGSVEKISTTYTYEHKLNVLDYLVEENKFLTEQAALNKIQEIINGLPEKYTFLKDLTEVTQYVDFDGSIVGDVFKEESGESGMFTKTLSGTDNFMVIKQASTYLVVWTPTKLSLDDENKFIADLDVKEPSLHVGNYARTNIIFKYGYGTLNLSSLGPQWTSYTFSYNIDTNETTFTCENNKISHLLYGKLGGSSYWKIGGKIKVSEQLPAWYYKVTIVTYSYEIGATGEECKDVYKADYNYERKTMTCSDPSYALSYEVEKITYKNYMEIEWFVGSQFLGSGGTTPPNTNLYVETTSYTKYFMISFVGLLILLKTRKYIFNK